jgi:hypothetical protein
MEALRRNPAIDNAADAHHREQLTLQKESGRRWEVRSSISASNTLHAAVGSPAGAA